MNHGKSKYNKSYKILGENIKIFRNKNNISQEELAFKINSARNYIGCIERGEKVPSISFLLDIACALGCKLSDLTKNV